MKLSSYISASFQLDIVNLRGQASDPVCELLAKPPQLLQSREELTTRLKDKDHRVKYSGLLFVETRTIIKAYALV